MKNLLLISVLTIGGGNDIFDLLYVVFGLGVKLGFIHLFIILYLCFLIFKLLFSIQFFEKSLKDLESLLILFVS